MYKIDELEFANLELAMAHAKLLNKFVTITGPDFEVCGMFGVDSVRNGVCPDGVKYDWNKASRIGAPKRVRAWPYGTVGKSYCWIDKRNFCKAYDL